MNDMWAWRLEAPGKGFDYKQVPEPVVRAGTVRVRVDAAPLLSYLRAYTAGELTALQPPDGEFTPGTNGVGVVDEVGEDVWHLHAGQRVVLSPYIVADENVDEPAEVLAGLTAMSEGSGMLQAWPDGTLAEKVLVPASAVTPVPDTLRDVDGETLAALSRCVVPYGGLLRGRLAAGETLIVHGATGAFGSAAVLVGLAMGAERVIAAGRNPSALASLSGLPRVRTVEMTGDVGADMAALRQAADGGAHCGLDIVGRASDPAGTLSALRSLRRRGRLVLMGSMTVPLTIDYGEFMSSGWELIGNFMYPRQALRHLLRLVAAGLLDLDRIPRRPFPMSELREAMNAAERPAAPLIVMTTT
jgi:alcohol dehydrogenase